MGGVFMKKIKKLLGTLLGIALTFGTMGGYVNAAPTENETKTTSQIYAEAMAPGWNLGNTFDGFDTGGDKGEESWGNPKVTKELIHTIKEQGFKSIRMPFTTEMRIGEAPEYKIDEAFLNRYAEVVDWALEEDLYIMINVHHDSWIWAYNIGGDDQAPMEKYIAIWKQLAERFKNYPEKVCFESLNEPFFNGEEAQQIEINNKVNETFYDLIRKSGGKNATRMLVLPTLNTNDSQARCDALYNSIKALNDSNIIATFHYYGYWPFSVNIAGTTTFDETTRVELENAFNRVYDTFVKKGIGVICGEYGLLGFDTSLDAIEHGEMLKYFEYISYYAKTKDITLMLWDNGQHMGRTTYKWSDPELYEMIKADGKKRSSYTETDRVFVNKADKNEDVKLKLTLNGNKLTSITDEKGILQLGKEYTCTDELLTLKGSYIDQVVGKDFGQSMSLKLKYSEGADWTIYINHYKLLELSSATGTIEGLSIPAKFNGTRISTMEAFYKDGSIAGPQNWTSFKEFAYTFAPDYKNNQIIIKDKFFAECNDGEVLLKFYLQSGEIVEYSLTKTGTKVVGKAL